MYFYRRGTISPVRFNETDLNTHAEREKKELGMRERRVGLVAEGAEVRTVARKVCLVVTNIGKATEFLVDFFGER